MKLLLFIVFSCFSLLTCGAEDNELLDFSGLYHCKGVDAHEGEYTGYVRMKIVPEHSRDGYTSYQFTLEVPGFGVYKGHAAAEGNFAAIHFALPADKGLYGGQDQDFGTGIARFRYLNDKWQFKKFYFEPLYKGGNTGIETCVQQ